VISTADFGKAVVGETTMTVARSNTSAQHRVLYVSAVSVATQVGASPLREEPGTT